MIIFKKVKFKNFGSFGNYFTEIDLQANRKNLVSGSNGHGKSFAFLDSITFGLYGKPFRKINIPQLVNTINEKNCLVEVEFDIGDDSYLVRRGIKPKIFEIHKNGNLIDQNAKAKDYQRFLEETILKMNYKSFTQVVILGSSSFIPFMQLPAADRRSVIEDILDINIFSSMNGLLKEKVATHREELRDYDYRLDLMREKINVQRNYINTLKNKSDVELNSFLSELDTTDELIESTQKKIHELTKECDDLLNQAPKSKDETIKKLTKMQTLHGQMKSNINKINESIDFFDENDNCPTCFQKIDKDSESIVQYIDGRKTKLTEIEDGIDKIEELIEDEKKYLTKLEDLSTKVQKKQEKISELNKQLYSANNYKSKLQKKIEELKKSGPEDKEAQKKIEEFEFELKELESSKKDIIEELYLYDIAASMLKDSGIKRKIIQHYLPVMNKLINKYLSAMDFFANFTLDEEFNETIKSRYRDTFSYMSFSEGEKLRIDLALLLAWREVARIKNSANTNILILDEVFDSSLDSVGTEEFLKLLETISSNAHVFVVSHKADQLVDKFDAMITFEKKNNFSKMIVG